MKKLLTILILIILSKTCYCQSVNDTTNAVIDIEHVILYDIDTFIDVRIEGLIIFKSEPKIGRIIKSIFILYDGDYLEISPLYIRYSITSKNNKNKVQKFREWQRSRKLT